MSQSNIVLVVGPDAEVQPLLSELRRAGYEAWSDQLDRVAGDVVSLDWADALVVVDSTQHLEARYLRLITEFSGPSILGTPTTLSGADLVDLYDRGFDAVVTWPSPAGEITARVRRLLEALAPMPAAPVKQMRARTQRMRRGAVRLLPTS